MDREKKGREGEHSSNRQLTGTFLHFPPPIKVGALLLSSSDSWKNALLPPREMSGVGEKK